MKKLLLFFSLFIFTAFSINAQSISITTNSNPLEGGTTTGNGNYVIGTTVTINALPNSGYTFTNWTEGSAVASTDANYSFIASADRNLIANFTLNSYTISTSSSPAEGGTTTGDGTYDYGSNVTVTATPATGYTFIKWTDGVSVVSSDANYTFSASEDKNLVANFSLMQHNLTTSIAPIGSGTVNGGGTYNHGTTANVEALPETGYEFVNWSGDLSSTQNPESILMDSDKSVQANFSLKSYNITTNSQPAIGGTTSGSGTYTHGDQVVLVATPATGYTFENWKNGNTIVSADSEYTFVASEDLNLTAYFLMKSYVITATPFPLEGGTITGLNAGGVYSHGAMVNLTANPSEGYVFVNWTEDGNSVSADANYSFPANSNRTLVANFTLSNYVITTSSNPVIGGNTSGAGGYNHGDSVSVIATPSSNYSFVNWTEGNVELSTDSIYSFIALANRNLVANFELKKHSIITSPLPVEGGTTTGDGEFTHGTSVTVMATPKTGWKFDHWKEGNVIVSTDSIYQFTIFSDRNLTGIFSKRVFAISISNVPAQGGIAFGAGNYEYDSEVKVIANPNSGWRFVSWKNGNTVLSNDSIYIFNAVENVSLTANYEKKQYMINTVASPQNAGFTTGGSLYTHGDPVRVKAITYSDAGYNFVNWTENGNVVSTIPEYSFIATENRDLIANFTLKSYNVVLSVNPSNSGSISGEGSYFHGDSVTIRATPNSGWNFGNWTENGINISSDLEYKFEITNNRNIVANFGHELYTVDVAVNPTEAGFISGSGSYFYDQKATLFATANAGWEFKNWTENGVVKSSSTTYEITVVKNRSFVANFSLRNYSINCTASPPEGGTVNGSGLFHYNQEVTVSAMPSSGYKFVHWLEGDSIVSTLQEYTFTVDDDKDLVAVFDFDTGIESIDDNMRIPEDYYMSNPYPNPFNPSTNIQFGLPETSEVSILIYNVNGELIKEIMNGVVLPSGNYNNSFSANDLASGLYFYRIFIQSTSSDKNFSKVGKLILVK